MLRTATLAAILTASSPAAAQEHLEMGDAPDVDLFLAAQNFALVLTAGGIQSNAALVSIGSN